MIKNRFHVFDATGYVDYAGQSGFGQRSYEDEGVEPLLPTGFGEEASSPAKRNDQTGEIEPLLPAGINDLK